MDDLPISVPRTCQKYFLQNTIILNLRKKNYLTIKGYVHVMILRQMKRSLLVWGRHRRDLATNPGNSNSSSSSGLSESDPSPSSSSSSPPHSSEKLSRAIVTFFSGSVVAVVCLSPPTAATSGEEIAASLTASSAILQNKSITLCHSGHLVKRAVNNSGRFRELLN